MTGILWNAVPSQTLMVALPAMLKSRDAESDISNEL